MNRQKAKELLPIIQAYAEGKIIQVKGPDNRWYDYDRKDCKLKFDSNSQKYRIKSKCRPSKNQLPIKDGDIMMTMDKRAFIANGIIDSDGCPCAYCGINLHNDFTIGTTIHGWTSSPYIPASEEAKKELFIKMGIAGYTWNAKTLKLEKIEPKYRPFRNKEECWNEMLKHQPFGWVKNKIVENEYYLTDGVFYSENLECPVVSMSGEALSYEEMINDYLFADGTPFGIKE